MSKTISGKAYYFAHETARMAGISKATLLRWISNGIVSDSAKRDRNGWRIFSEAEVRVLKRLSEKGK